MSYELKRNILIEMNYFANLNKKVTTMSKSIIQQKSFSFAVEIVNLYKFLSQEKKEFVLSKQLLRSGTSIGANVSEALFGQSSKDFIHKLHISRKETNESIYWIELLHATEYVSPEQYKGLLQKSTELRKMLTSIILTMEQKKN